MVFYFEDIKPVEPKKPGFNISQLIKQEKITFGEFEYSKDIQMECIRYTSEKFLIPRVFVSVDSFYYIYYHCIKNLNGTSVPSETRIEAFKNYTKKQNLQYNELIIKQFRKDFKAKKQPIYSENNNNNNNKSEITNKEVASSANDNNEEQQKEKEEEKEEEENGNQILKLKSQLNKKEQQEKENGNLILKLQSQLNEKEKQIKEFEQQKSPNLKRKREDEETEISKLYSSFTSSAQIPCVKFLLDSESVAPSFMFQMASTNFSIKIEICKTNTNQ